MSRPHVSKEDAIYKLYSTIRTKFEQDGVLQEVRCLLQTKMVALMKGRSDNRTPMVPRHTTTTTTGSRMTTAAGTSAVGDPDGGGSSGGAGGDGVRDARIQLLNQLIMEYFHWHGFHYTAEMFATESDGENVRPVRDCLEGALGEFPHRNLPILLEIVSDLVEQKKK